MFNRLVSLFFNRATLNFALFQPWLARRRIVEQPAVVGAVVGLTWLHSSTGNVSQASFSSACSRWCISWPDMATFERWQCFTSYFLFSLTELH